MVYGLEDVNCTMLLLTRNMKNILWSKIKHVDIQRSSVVYKFLAR